MNPTYHEKIFLKVKKRPKKSCYTIFEKIYIFHTFAGVSYFNANLRMLAGFQPSIVMVIFVRSLLSLI